MDKNAVCESVTALVCERYALQKQLAEAKNDVAACAKKIEELNAMNKVLDDEVTRLREAKE